MKNVNISFAQQLVSRCLSLDILHITKENKDSLIHHPQPSTLVYSMKDAKRSFEEYHQMCADGMIFNIITPIHVHFCTLCISKEFDEHLIIGPFLDHQLSDTTIYKVIELLHLNIEHASQFKLFYQAIPIVDETKVTEITCLIRQYLLGESYRSQPQFLDCRTEFQEQKSLTFSTEEIEKNIAYQLIENRYEEETNMMNAIANGDISKAQLYWKNFSTVTKSIVRTKDSIRNKKNLLVIGNTLYRKAAQNGGVHPVYLDEISTKWAIRIENATSIDALDDMLLQMIRGYCLLVKNHSLSQYTPIVKKAITYINLNIASTLTVTDVASEVGVSPDYLTRLFKKELNVPVINYINQKRIQASLKLLNTTDLCIQDIGDLVGLTDTSYFNKLFKKYIGISPKQYRESLK